MVRQMMLGLRAAGAEVYEYNTDENPEALDCEGRPYDRGRFGPVWLVWDALRPQIEEFSPDLIVCNAGGLSFRPDQAKKLRKSTMLLGVALSDPDVFSPATSRIAANFDLFLTNAPGCVPGYRASGANAGVLPLATNEEFFHPVEACPGLDCEVLVIGRASPDRIEPVRRLCERFRVHLYGEGWEQHDIPATDPIYGEDLLRALNSARISVVFSRTPAGHCIAKIAVLDFIASGALVATERIPELESYFEYDSEIIGFRNQDELFAKIHYHLEHPTEALAIREAGRRRVLRDHTWSKVWPGIIGQIQRSRAGPC
jgi:hypothetical protein